MSQTLELIAATLWFWTFSIGFLVSIFTSITLLFCPSLWWSVPLYFAWIIYDRKTSETGGRPVEWVRQWAWWRLMKSYFSFQLLTDGSFQLDETKNYIFGCYPHGIYPAGTFASFVDGYQRYFPKHKAFTTVLTIQFWMPVLRELFLATGSVSVSGPSIKYLLKRAQGGNIVSILIGGGDEAKYSIPGKYKIILQKRKGFVKMALQNGAPLVPVITFGETDLFDQLDFPGFGVIRNLVKTVTQVGVVIPYGNRFICPHKVPLTTVVGRPIDVGKVENPTNEEIEVLHEKFVNHLKQLFDDYKGKYVKDPEKTVLEIV